ncbi:MAG: hypothetical protein IJ366_09800 [Clostridia bacterium]|nr:hypothetical protein [Clostridia bacterium]
MTNTRMIEIRDNMAAQINAAFEKGVQPNTLLLKAYIDIEQAINDADTKQIHKLYNKTRNEVCVWRGCAFGAAILAMIAAII